MKKKSFYLVLIPLFLCFISCASLQKDVYTSREDNAMIYNLLRIYEYQFIKTDAKMHMESEPPLTDINNLLTEITNYRHSTNVAEPYLIARLRAFEGLLNNMAGKNREAETAYKEARGLQKSDSYVQLLGTRLNKKQDAQFAAIDEILAKDSKNAVILLEKGKLLYKESKYNEAVANLDNAFILFDEEGLVDYREVYSPLRSNAWELYKITDLQSDLSIGKIDLQAPLTKNSLIDLTLANSSFFANKKAISSYLEQLNIQETTISRKLCARFIWNAYVQRYGNLKMLTRYSDKYKKSGRASPIEDVLVSDPDFDAVLGVVENEFLELPDGKSFKPDDKITNLEYITCLKKADK